MSNACVSWLAVLAMAALVGLHMSQQPLGYFRHSLHLCFLLCADLGSFAESATAYLQAGQPVHAVRVHLQRLGDVQAALQAAQGSAEGGLLLSCSAATVQRLLVVAV